MGERERERERERAREIGMEAGERSGETGCRGRGHTFGRSANHRFPADATRQGVHARSPNSVNNNLPTQDFAHVRVGPVVSSDPPKVSERRLTEVCLGGEILSGELAVGTKGAVRSILLLLLVLSSLGLPY